LQALLPLNDGAAGWAPS